MRKLAILLALPLSGCISFAAKPPPSLLTLASAVAVPAGQTQSSAQAASITIAVPVVPQELATARVPVRASDTTVAYVKDAQWVEGPQRLFARLLADTVTARTGRVVLSGRQAQLDPGAQLSGELRSFGVESTTREAVVVFDATLARGDAPAFEKRRFEARAPLTAIDATTVGPALSIAANQVAEQVADWVGR
jgi:cholesterol transport system auxiliary component